jgi:hypothetical protein
MLTNSSLLICDSCSVGFSVSHAAEILFSHKEIGDQSYNLPLEKSFC